MPTSDMSRSRSDVNHVVFTGELVKDAQVNSTSRGVKQALLSLRVMARNREGEPKVRAFLTCICYGGLGDLVEDAQRGERVLVSGYFQTRDQSREGEPPDWRMEVVCDRVIRFDVGDLPQSLRERADAEVIF